MSGNTEKMIGTLSALLVLSQTQISSPRNVILMVSDGTGFNTYAAAAMYEGKLGREVFDGKGWTQLAMSTYPLTNAGQARMSGQQDPHIVYDPAKAWAKDRYLWLQSTPTDSAAAATALATGQKTYNGAICWSDMDQPITNIGDVYRKEGRPFGVVTTVLWSDATPSAMVAHNRKRSNPAEIAQEMVEKSRATVIMGAGHPWYDADGKRRQTQGDAKSVGDKPYFTTPIDTFGDARIIESKSDFEALANGKLNLKGCSRVVGTVQANGSTQHDRSTKDWNGDGKADQSDARIAPPFGDPLNRNIPSLATMAKGALNVLSKQNKGFFLMVEGGAIDHANHANQPGRMVEEALGFFRAVEAVNTWVGKNGGWSKNLVIVTSDHETGCLWGPYSRAIPFHPIVDMGKGKLPGVKHLWGGHTNSLVPLFAKGAGSELLNTYATKTDPVRGRYLDNTDVFKVICP